MSTRLASSACVVPMEITFMDNGGKYNLYNEFTDMNSHI
jgi:hypothetical protein